MQSILVVFLLLITSTFVYSDEDIAVETPSTKEATTADTKESKESVVAIINGEVIYQIELDQFIAQNQANNPMLGNKEVALDNLITIKVLSQEAQVLDLAETKTVQAQIALQKMGILANTAIEHWNTETTIEEDILRQEYDRQVAMVNDKEYNANHILVETEEKAEEIIKLLSEGNDFAALAKEHSQDPGSAVSGGQLGWFSLDMMVPEFSQAVAAMEKGSISTAPVKSPFGYHIIQLVDVRQTPIPSFEEVKTQLEEFMKERMLQGYIANLRQAAEIKIY